MAGRWCGRALAFKKPIVGIMIEGPWLTEEEARARTECFVREYAQRHGMALIPDQELTWVAGGDGAK